MARNLARHAENRQIVGLGAAAREDHPVGLRPGEPRSHHLGNLAPSIFEQPTGMTPGRVQAGRIARGLAANTVHRPGHLRQHRSRRVVIEIDRFHRAALGERRPLGRW